MLCSDYGPVVATVIKDSLLDTYLGSVAAFCSFPTLLCCGSMGSYFAVLAVPSCPHLSLATGLHSQCAVSFFCSWTWFSFAWNLFSFLLVAIFSLKLMTLFFLTAPVRVPFQPSATLTLIDADLPCYLFGSGLRLSISVCFICVVRWAGELLQAGEGCCGCLGCF